MTEAWIHSHLPISADGSSVILGAAQGCLITDLVKMFGNVDTTYSALSATPQATSGGWQKYFDAWKAKGLIS